MPGKTASSASSGLRSTFLPSRWYCWGYLQSKRTGRGLALPMLNSALILGEHLQVRQRHFCISLVFMKGKGWKRKGKVVILQMYKRKIHCPWLDHKASAILFSSSALMHWGQAWQITWETLFIPAVLSALCQAILNRLSLYRKPNFFPYFFHAVTYCQGKKPNIQHYGSAQI